ncbi:DUF2510 domain-containing protein [Mycolicibacterium porcinum]|uniref:DUF2510 domain-containing protein n=1 Tax=Mycolicibacterium porcinum TaxID=39693 RepID=UPI0031F7FB7C
MSAQPGWYPSPDGQRVFRYFDGTRWTDQTNIALPAADQPRTGSSKRAWFLVAALGLVVVVVAGVLVSTLVDFGKRTSAEGGEGGPSATLSSRSVLIPELNLAPGSKLADQHAGQWEQWDVPMEFPLTVEALRQQLPIGRDYDGLPWCSEYSRPTKIDGVRYDLTTWSWGSEADFMSVSMNPAPWEKSHTEVMLSREPSESGCVR